MSHKGASRKEQIDKFTIVKKSFYIEAFRSDYYPDGILRLYRVTRGTTEPRPSPYYYQSVRIKNPEELAKVKPVLDRLASKLKWQELPPLLKALEERLRKEKAIHPEILRIVKQYPKASIGMLRAFDRVYHGKVDIEDFDLVSEYTQTALESLLGKQRMMINLYIDLIDKLGKEKTPEGIKRLLKLLEEYDLPQLTTVTSILTDRLQRLRAFAIQIQNEKAYEIKGKTSIHNQLSNALWIIDDSYWLLHSNEPLTNFLKKESRTSTRQERLRPDFICASNKHTLVIVEIKRPSHSITIEDINQLQKYLVAVDKYDSKFTEKKGFLIGREISDDNRKIVNDYRSIEFRSYLEIVNECRRRYQEYLDALEKQD